MELTVAQVANTTGTSPQYVRRAIAAGELAALRRIGRTVILDDLAVQAWDRSRARGRRWSEDVRRAAFDLLDAGTTQRLSSSERSRLRSRMRTATARDLAHLAGALGGGWARYRRNADGHLEGAAVAGLLPADLERLGLTAGNSRMALVTTPNLTDFELDNNVTLDASGDLGVVERDEAGGRARALLDTYLLGSSRESNAAAAAIEEIAHAL